MLFIVVAITIAYAVVVLLRAFLNDAKSKLDRIFLPMTFKNVFFLTALEEGAARDRAKKQELEDDLILSRELVRAELKQEFLDLLAEGRERTDALESVILGDASASDEARESSVKFKRILSKEIV